jgi:hypothetical protein
MVDGPGMPRLWNRLLDELQANTLVSAASPLLLSKDTGGLRLGIIIPQQQSDSSGGGTVVTGIVNDCTGTGSAAVYDITLEDNSQLEAVAINPALVSDSFLYAEFAIDDRVLVWKGDDDNDPLVMSVPPMLAGTPRNVTSLPTC